MRNVVYGLLLSLYVLHTDVWYWNDPRLVLGLPIGVTYHVLWTLLVSAVFWLAVEYSWPSELESSVQEQSLAGGHDRAAESAAGNRDGDHAAGRR